MKITEKLVLGTVQFGIDYGIANVSGKPSKQEVSDILELAWRKGIIRFDTAPAYGSEELIGEFIKVNGLEKEAKVLTKIPSLEGVTDYEKAIKTSLEASLNNLGCPVDVLFFHNPADSKLLLEYPELFEKLLYDYPVNTLGVSVYEPKEVKCMLDWHSELAFQFPFNVLDRRFEHVSMPQGKRYVRSVFMQGLLASAISLRHDAPVELLNLQKEYHDKLADLHLAPVGFAVSFAARSDSVDLLLIGVDSKEQLQEILNLHLYNQKDIAMFDVLAVNSDEHWFDPRNWSSI